jgi:hypothetical protein
VKVYNNQDPEDVCKNFIEDIENYALYSYELTQRNKENILFTNNEKLNHKKTTKCSECNCVFNENKKKVAHHDHINKWH